MRNTGTHNKKTTNCSTVNRSQKKNKYNTDIIDRLKAKFGVSRRFITQSLSGDRKSETSESIVKEYGQLQEKINNALNG